MFCAHTEKRGEEKLLLDPTTETEGLIPVVDRIQFEKVLSYILRREISTQNYSREGTGLAIRFVSLSVPNMGG